MISYAQNAEDVVLARLFSERAVGRYVDIGAGDPVEASVTKHFYDNGWRGINIEPIPSLAERLRSDRPEDVTLAVAIGATPGKAVLHVVENEWGWSTLDDELARSYHEDHNWQLHDVEVDVITLADVLDRHPGAIDFLKIDVEGAERDVIEGADWTHHRPRVIVVEATSPGAPTPTHDEWEPILLDAGYRCALFDGLNRFYAAADDEEALRHLAAPANVFDEFETYALRRECDAHAALTAYARRLENTLHEAHAAREQDAEYLRKLEHTITESQRESARTDRYVIALERRIAELETSNVQSGRQAASLARQLPSASPATTSPVREPEHPIETPEDFVKRTNARGGSYHRLALPGGLVVDGIYDMAKYLPYFHLPERLDGMTVLDVGTASGFFAIECERRGADVTAIDVADDRLLPDVIPVFGLDIHYELQDLYELDTSFGEFDLVICGTLLLHLPDPVGALRALRKVTRTRLVLSTTTTPGSATDEAPTCHFFGERAGDGEYWSYWGFSAAALERMLVAAGFARVENVEHFGIAPEPGHAGAVAPQVVLSAYV